MSIFCHMTVSYNNNVTNIVDFHGRDEANANSHKLSFD